MCLFCAFKILVLGTIIVRPFPRFIVTTSSCNLSQQLVYLVSGDGAFVLNDGSKGSASHNWDTVFDGYVKLLIETLQKPRTIRLFE